jgi:protein-tyrosine-phosphatase
MLSHPLRWQLVRALVSSDLRVQELVDSVHQPYNLVSYHLKLLRRSGLVAMHQSDADGRDLYYCLEVEKLQAGYQAAAGELFPGWTWHYTSGASSSPQPQQVLFLCTHNTARSQMAEGWLRHLGGDNFLVASAGSQPQALHPDAVWAMSERGIDISSQRAKHIADLPGQRFDLVITVCDRVREECLRYALCKTDLHWSIPDPVGIRDDLERRRAFAATADTLERRIRRLIGS